MTWQDILRIADEAEPGVARRFLEAVAAAGTLVNVARLRALVARGRRARRRSFRDQLGNNRR